MRINKINLKKKSLCKAHQQIEQIVNNFPIVNFCIEMKKKIHCSRRGRKLCCEEEERRRRRRRLRRDRISGRVHEIHEDP